MYVRVCVEERGGLKLIDVRVFDIRCDVYVFLSGPCETSIFTVQTRTCLWGG
jgi:hypothetical protein